MYKLTKKQKDILLDYIANGGRALFYDDIPEPTRQRLEAIKWHESLWMEAQRFIGDNVKINYNPRWA